MTIDPSSGTDGALATVLCPNGHPNVWNYRFCGECGLPIGLVSWPSDESASAETRSRWRVPLLIAVLAVVVTAAVVTAVVMVASPFTQSGAQSPRPAATPVAGVPSPAGPAMCPLAPLIQTESIDLRSDGLVVAAAFRSSCGGGDVESNSALEVTVADGQRDVAAGAFDFSAAPLVLEQGMPARRTLVFPPGMFWRTPEMLSGPPELIGTRKGKSDHVAPKTGSGTTTMIAAAPAKPAHGSVDVVAEAVLTELRDADYAAVQALMSNRWVPQVSSKRVGLTVKGKALTNADILRDHLAFRQRFDGARLVWSGDWTTFSGTDFWVTVVGPSYYLADEANSWCDSHDLGVNDCFAKYLSTMFGVEGTTVYRK